jgi:hypothetical protein
LGLQNLHVALRVLHLSADIQLVKLNDDVDAQAQRFLGSPSFRVNGDELWPERRELYALGCRIYRTADGLRGTPTVEMLREKLRDLRQSQSLL